MATHVHNITLVQVDAFQIVGNWRNIGTFPPAMVNAMANPRGQSAALVPKGSTTNLYYFDANENGIEIMPSEFVVIEDVIGTVTKETASSFVLNYTAL